MALYEKRTYSVKVGEMPTVLKLYKEEGWPALEAGVVVVSQKSSCCAADASQASSSSPNRRSAPSRVQGAPS